MERHGPQVVVVVNINASVFFDILVVGLLLHANQEAD